MSDTPPPAPEFRDDVDEAPPLHKAAAIPTINPRQSHAEDDKTDVHQEAFDLEPAWYLRDEQTGEFVSTPLLGFTEARQTLARRLMQCNVPIAASNYGNDMDAHAPEAWIVLWLCLHEPEEWRELRGSVGLFLETIEAWAAVHCPRPLWIEAVTVVFEMWKAARTNEVIVKRKPGTGRQSK